MARGRTVRAPSIALAVLSLACLDACEFEHERRPLFLLDTQGAPSPRFLEGVARILDVDVAPSFVDVGAIRGTGLSNALSSAYSVDCRNRNARGVIHVWRDVAAYWKDTAVPQSSADVTISASSCSGAEGSPLYVPTVSFFRPHTEARPTADELRVASLAADSAALRRLSAAVRKDPAMLEAPPSVTFRDYSLRA